MQHNTPAHRKRGKNKKHKMLANAHPSNSRQTHTHSQEEDRPDQLSGPAREQPFEPPREPAFERRPREPPWVGEQAPMSPRPGPWLPPPETWLPDPVPPLRRPVPPFPPPVPPFPQSRRWAPASSGGSRGRSCTGPRRRRPRTFARSRRCRSRSSPCPLRSSGGSVVAARTRSAGVHNEGREGRRVGALNVVLDRRYGGSYRSRCDGAEARCVATGLCRLLPHRLIYAHHLPYHPLPSRPRPKYRPTTRRAPSTGEY